MKECSLQLGTHFSWKQSEWLLSFKVGAWGLIGATSRLWNCVIIQVCDNLEYE